MGIITGKDLQRMGWPQGRVIRMAKAAADVALRAEPDKNRVLSLLEQVRLHPADFTQHPVFAELAAYWLAEITPKPEPEAVKLREEPLPFRIWGAHLIDPNAQEQMRTAMQLPVSVAGALMPDAHVGYGLPIGGVLATQRVLIPYAVGVDIACRMMLSIFPESPDVLKSQHDRLKKALISQTHFGIGDAWRPEDHKRPHHDVLDDPDWNAMPLLRSLQQKAVLQLGSSGSGNHFVEWGSLTLAEDDAVTGLKAGPYVALLSHSGSRGVGARIAEHFTKRAQALHPDLPRAVQHLAWLEDAHEDGQAYWLAMQLAGRFAQANHHVIHRRIADAAGLQPLLQVENHHNFAWQETLPDGTPVYVHRKGATPAGKGVMGIIPGSMGDVGYWVRGLGLPESLNSASHGAGRQMSRLAARENITQHDRDARLREMGVTLISGGLDEAPQAYKPIQDVMKSQSDLVEVIGVFRPSVVRMD